jgi:glycosyltransferase involved in cell wall biosynthesis
MIRAFARLAREGLIHGPLIIAGAPVDNKYAAEIARTIRNDRMADRVHLLGSVSGPELDKLYRNARLFIFPSLSENAGSYALIDAFAYGLPVLSSNRSSMPEIVGDGALMFDPTDERSLENSLRQFLCTPGLEASLAKRSAERIAFFPTWSDIADQLVSFGERLVISDSFSPVHPTDQE